MKPDFLLKAVVRPTLFVLGPQFASVRAEALLLAIAIQESGLAARRQLGGGPARGLWQFEPGNSKSQGGVWGIFHHQRLAPMAKSLCESLLIPADPTSAYEAIALNDVLACGLARLLLWSHPAPLPNPNDLEASWQYYRSLWRPGRPRHEKWPESIGAALAAISGEEA